jgi:hypothetical protein
MAIKMIESFDYLANLSQSVVTPLASSKWVGGTWVSSANMVALTDFVPDGRMCMSMSGGADPRWQAIGSHEKWIVGHDINYPSATPATGEVFTIGYEDGATWSPLVRIDRTAGNALEIYTGTDRHATTADGVVTLAAGNFYELQAYIATSTGSIELWVDADKLVDVSNIDTKGTTTATHFNQWRSTAGVGTKQFSNMRIWDGSGTDYNEALGKVTHNTTVLVDANGTTNDWTTTDTATNYELVDDTTAHDGDTTFLEGATASQTQFVGIVDLPANRVEIHGVQTTVVARRAAGGDNDLHLLALSNGVTATGGDEAPGGQRNLSSSYWWLNEIFETDPDTLTVWEATAARDYEPGWKLATAEP